MHNKAYDVLIVDDDDVSYQIINRYLKKVKGYSLNTEYADSYDKATKLLAAHNYDLYLFDYNLGSYSGIELISKLRNKLKDDGSAIDGALPIILLTGMNDTKTVTEAFQAGFCDFLCKDDINAINLNTVITNTLNKCTGKNLLQQHKSELVKDSTKQQELQVSLCQEILSPLRSITDDIKKLKEELKEDISAKHTKSFDTILNNCKFTTSYLKDFIKICNEKDSDFDNISPDFYSLNSLIKSAVSMLNHNLEKSNIKLIVEYLETDIEVFVDKIRIKQAITSLLNNAIKSSPKNSTIKIKTKHLTEGVRIAVYDSGPGFSKLEQSENINNNLDLCKKLLSSHKIDIKFKSELCQGSVFYFKLPTSDTWYNK